MNRFFGISLGVLIIQAGFLASCQSPASKMPKPGSSLEEQATIFIKSMVGFDIETSVDCMLPEYVAQMGGRESVLAIYAKDVKQYKEDGFKLSGGKVDQPSAYSKCNGTLQCVLRQEVTMEMTRSGSEPFKMEANLIAVSSDNGLTWKFLQPGQENLQSLRQKFPILCEDLVLRKY